MILSPKTLSLPVGAVTLRSALPADAAALARHHRAAAAETHFLSRNPDECGPDPAPLRERLAEQARHPRSFNLAAFLDGGLAGFLEVAQLRHHRKVRHRAALGISIRAACCGMGLGRAMVSLAVAQARDNGFSQLELGVFSDNLRAIRLYESLGFEACGRTPRAFRLDDGTELDELLMVLPLEAP